MRRAIFFALALLFAGTIAAADDQSDSHSTAAKTPVPDPDAQYFIARQVTDRRFMTSIERAGPCTLRGPPVEGGRVKVPFQIYPQESLLRHEEGTVKLQLIFDSNWCVRKAIVVESSKYWRLDEVSLQWAMFIRWSPSKTQLTAEGEPTVTIPIGWGASQDKR